jgi:hypothetical protein
MKIRAFWDVAMTIALIMDAIRAYIPEGSNLQAIDMTAVNITD